MNKYKDALEEVANETVDRHADGYYQPKTVTHFHSGAIDALRELVEKATPMKPRGDLHSCPHYRCPTCKGGVKMYEDSPTFPYCPHCGQALD